MIFSTAANLTSLGQAQILILDGTFSSTPKGFRQVFTIHASVGNDAARKFMPFVHMLLPDKAETTYKKALKLVKNAAAENGVTLDPRVVLTDFEKAEINAVKKVFPDAVQYGCFFHLTKSWWRRMQKLGLTGKYCKSIRMQLTFKQTEALAFLKPKNVPEGLAAIRASAPQSMQPFLDYVEKNYVLGKIRSDGRRGIPRFAPKFWSMRHNLLKGLPRTTNAIEGYHNKFNSLLKGGSDLKFYAVLNAFKEEEQSTSAEFLRYLQGDVPVYTSRMKKLQQKEEKLKQAIRSSRDISMADHLLSLALILQNK